MGRVNVATRRQKDFFFSQIVLKIFEPTVGPWNKELDQMEISYHDNRISGKQKILVVFSINKKRISAISHIQENYDGEWFGRKKPVSIYWVGRVIELMLELKRVTKNFPQPIKIKGVN